MLKIVDESVLDQRIWNWSRPICRGLIAVPDKQDRNDARKAVKDKIMARCFAEGPERNGQQGYGRRVFENLETKIMRSSISSRHAQRRPRHTTVRQMVTEIGVLPATHGSALFARGETKALVVATLGTEWDEQCIETLLGRYLQAQVLLHYNFPPFRSAKPDASAAPSGVKSATANWPTGDPPDPAAAPRISPSPCASFPRSRNPTVIFEWPRSAAPRWR